MTSTATGQSWTLCSFKRSLKSEAMYTLRNLETFSLIPKIQSRLMKGHSTETIVLWIISLCSWQSQNTSRNPVGLLQSWVSLLDDAERSFLQPFGILLVPYHAFSTPNVQSFWNILLLEIRTIPVNAQKTFSAKLLKYSMESLSSFFRSTQKRPYKCPDAYTNSPV